MYADAENAYNQYRRTAIMTASGDKLLLMLYDGLVTDLKKAKQAIEQKDPAGAHTFLMKGQNIITELMRTLKMEYAISTDLYRLYDYLRRCLIRANIKKDPAIVEEVLDMAAGLRTTWMAAASQARAGEKNAGNA
jgi:flagellar protein FliS